MRDLKEAIRRGELIFGIYSLSSSPTVVEMLGYAGLDFVIIDTEHGAAAPMSLELENLIRAAYAADIAPLVRVNEVDAGEIEKALGFGAHGVIIPHLQTKEDAIACVSAAFYPPEGARGACPLVRANKVGWIEWESYRKQCNEKTLVIPLIEDIKGFANLEDILAVKGIGAVQWGFWELSMELGYVTDPVSVRQLPQWVEKYEEKVFDTCRKTGVPMFAFAFNFERAEYLLERGCKVITLGTDLGIIRGGLLDLTGRIDKDLRSLGKRELA